ncbi:carbohydrate ABC transporter permease [Lacrimispora algidixylanolytica]|uniref:Transporter n=1 Tax=Lacrimispora algidixylanolytica TaxID=94868 RepID=A0A419T0I9_9FIRM|nr:sugar ABC transporter permease [Lacrimispora algidixylanolytica]RKD30963.1 transporter [Lacrimispora algidixylanolytica]
MNQKTKKRLQEFTFVLPALIIFAIFVVYPFLQGFPISFTKWDGMSPVKKYVGFSNYIRIFQDTNVLNAIKNTLIFTAVTMVFSNIFGLIFALMISKKSKINNILRTCIFVPYCLSLVLSSYIWRYVYSDVFFDVFGIPSPLGSTVWVMFGLSVISIWRDTGYCMVVYIAAIQGVSKDYYEAAELEGATPWQKFKAITFPMIAPAVTANFTLLLAWGMKVFDYPMAATAGGPGRASETVAMLIYNNLFTYFKAGYGQAIAVVFTLAIFAVSTLVSKNLRAREVEI